MLGLSRSLVAVSVILLGAAADARASVPSLSFSLVKLFLLLCWVYSCLYLVHQVDESPLVPDEYRSALRVVTLFAGPLVFLVLVTLDIMKSGGEKVSFSEMLQRVKRAVLSIWHSRIHGEEEEPTLRLYDSLGTELSEIYGHGESRTGDRHVLDLTVKIIDNALSQRASDILIDPKDEAWYTVRLRIDGTLRVVQDLPAATSKAIINSVKAVSSMDISERRRPQDGAFTAKKGSLAASFRVASAGALNGEKLSIRVLNYQACNFTLADAGVPEYQRAVIATAISKPSGMVLICGPTGSGKTTTLYSMLNQIDRLTHNVITVEDPIESHLQEASQIEINPRADITFAKTLRSILRQDPDVICVGEIRDEETAEIALRAAQTGHLVLATIHCDSNATALIRLLDLGVSPLLLSSGLSLLVSQRLMRKLCDRCKKPALPNSRELQELRQKGIDPSRVCQPAGCDNCGGTGYHGRTAICDLLVVTDELRKAIAHDPEIASKLRSEGEKSGRSNIKTEGLRRVIAGITSFDEFKRVLG